MLGERLVNGRDRVEQALQEEKIKAPANSRAKRPNRCCDGRSCERPELDRFEPLSALEREHVLDVLPRATLFEHPCVLEQFATLLHLTVVEVLARDEQPIDRVPGGTFCADDAGKALIESFASAESSARATRHRHCEVLLGAVAQRARARE